MTDKQCRMSTVYMPQLWDVNGGQLQSEFRDHSSAINSLDFHPQELVLASGSDDKFVQLNLNLN